MESFVGRSQDVLAMTERRRKRLQFVLICLGSILAAAGILALLINGYINRKYRGYQVERTISVKNSSAMKYVSYEGGLLKYSRDGITAMNEDGKALWSGSYDMADPVVDICGSYVVAADIGGKDLFVYSGEDTGTELVTDYPILQACVSEQGVVAVLLEDASSNMIHVYNPYSDNKKLLVEIPTNVEEGYPVSMDLSPDGTSVVASYICVTAGVVQSKAAFYNFTEVGQNTNCLVGAQNYKDQVISEVRFLDDSTACLFSEKGFGIWQNMKKPEQIAEQKFNENIRSAFCSEDYVGVILDRAAEDKCDMKVYNMKGRNILDMKVPSEYTRVSVSGKEILLNSTSQCMIYRINGVKKFSCVLDQKITQFQPAKGANRYFLIRDSKIEKIKLRKK